MTFTAATKAEAIKFRNELRVTFAGTDWTFVIHAPLFDGDLYRIVIG